MAGWPATKLRSKYKKNLGDAKSKKTAPFVLKIAGKPRRSCGGKL